VPDREKPDGEIFVVPLQGNLTYSKSSKIEFCRMDLADGSIVIIKPGRDGFFDDNFTELRRYAVNMRRLIDFLEEKAKRDATKT
jgi:hypothetical protein